MTCVTPLAVVGAARVTADGREALLGHANHSMAGRYASSDVGRLLTRANLILNREGTCTGLRIANGREADRWIKGPAIVRQLGVRGDGLEVRASRRDHLAPYVDRMSGLRLVQDGEVATLGLRATK